MTPQQKAKWLSNFWAQIAEGKKAQEAIGSRWKDVETNKLVGPNMSSNHYHWRIARDPRNKWEKEGHSVSTYDSKVAAEWKADGWSVIEWVEVIK